MIYYEKLADYVLWSAEVRVAYMVEVEVKLRAADLYDYNLRHSYTNLAGILATIVGFVGVGYGIYSKYYLLAIVGAVLIVYTPLILILKVNQAFVITPALKDPFKYVLDENGLTVWQGEKNHTYPWGEMVKAVSTGRSIILYTTKYNATIIPRDQAGEKLPLVIQEISKYIDPKKNRIKQ